MPTEKTTPHADPVRQFLRHNLATIAYRGAAAFRGAPDSFAEFRAFETTRTPAQILAHMGDLFDWALSIAKGKEQWRDSKPLRWDEEKRRFFAALRALDDYLASDSPLPCPAERLFQGPIADSLTHVGQIAMLRRMAGAPSHGENFYVAEIVAGRVGEDQAAPRRQID
jgi:hypothetical protein